LRGKGLVFRSTVDTVEISVLMQRQPLPAEDYSGGDPYLWGSPAINGLERQLKSKLMRRLEAGEVGAAHQLVGGRQHAVG
jgi:hypothetical protein